MKVGIYKGNNMRCEVVPVITFLLFNGFKHISETIYIIKCKNANFTKNLVFSNYPYLALIIYFVVNYALNKLSA